MSVLKRKDSGIWEVVGGGEAPPIKLGYTANTSLSQTTTGTQVDITGLSVTVNVAAGRTIKITGHVGSFANTATACQIAVYVQEGTTILGRAGQSLLPSTQEGHLIDGSVVVVSPSAGSHTYKLTVSRASGSGTVALEGTATHPAFILVEDITGGSGAPSGPYGSTRAYRATSNVTLTNQTHTAIPLNAEEFDDDTLHDNSTNPSRFTIAATGRYEIVGQVAYASTSSTGSRHALIWKNGTGTGTRLAGANAPSVATVNPRTQVATGVVALTAGDYIELGGWQDSTANLDVIFGADQTWLSLKRIS